MNRKDVNHPFSVSLKRLRNWKGITQSELGASMDVNKTTISLYERGRIPSKHFVDQLVVFFKKEIDELGIDLYVDGNFYSELQISEAKAINEAMKTIKIDIKKIKKELGISDEEKRQQV